MWKKGNIYAYIAVYVDDLTITMTDPRNLQMSQKPSIISNSRELVQLHSSCVWISPEMRITCCVFHPPNTLTILSRIMNSYLV
jgi:hypothetical protein